MLGAILGDIVGSPYEFDHNNYKHKDFPLLSEKSHFTRKTHICSSERGRCLCRLERRTRSSGADS